MKIIIVGAGKIGTSIVHHVSDEEHEVVVIDNKSSVIEKIVNGYDVMGITGSGVSVEILDAAGVDKCDLFIAVTGSDETNMLACAFAKKMGASKTIARVRDVEYSKQLDLLKSTLDITMAINPELEAAKEISRIINFPEALKIETFAQETVELIELFVSKDSVLVNKSLAEINKSFKVDILLCAVTRGEEVIIPKGNFVIKPNDKIHICSKRSNTKSFINKLGFSSGRMKEIMIIGGGRISYYLAEELVKSKYHVKIVEKDMNKCDELCQILPGASIICGDGTSQTLLYEEGLDQSDAVICLTGSDEQNIIISMFANKHNVKKVVTKVNKISFGELLDSLSMASVFSCQEIVASQIVSYIRSEANDRGNNVNKLYKLVNNKLEALEFSVSDNSKVINIPLKDLKIKKDALIAVIIRDGEQITPNGNTVIYPNDTLIVVTTLLLNDLDDILE